MSDKSMADVADKAIDKLDQLAQAMASKAPEAWDLFVRAERVSGWLDVGTAIICAGLLAATYLLGRFAQRKYAGKYANEGWAILMIVTYLGAAMLVVPVIVNARSGIFSLAVPEHYAAMKVLEAVK